MPPIATATVATAAAPMGSGGPANGLAGTVGAVGGLAMVVGAFLPYVVTKAGSASHSVSGWNATGDAQAAAIVGLVAAAFGALLLVKAVPALARLALVGLGIAGAALAGYDLYDITQKLPKDALVKSSGVDTIQVGIGLFVVLGGGVLALLAGLLVRTKVKAAKPAESAHSGIGEAPPAFSVQPPSAPPVASPPAPASQTAPPAPSAPAPPTAQAPAPMAPPPSPGSMPPPPPSGGVTPPPPPSGSSF